MGIGGEKKGLREIAQTKAAARDEAFERIIERIKSSDGEIEKDETHPLYTEIGMEEFEIGSQRIIEFTLNKTDFQLTRNVETHLLQGPGKQKHLEELETPRIRINLKKKSPYSEDWQNVDLDEMF
ncbi:hypothetical protein GF366_02390 [Candidatus Peregrinibacteria bacterium]|nr:hypothetical protein [Candidatus Peregrinibacteria bacterium]